VTVAVGLILAGCGGPGAQAGVSPSSESPSPPQTQTAGSVSPSPSVPPWAAIGATCSGAPAAHEALVLMQGSTATVLADVSDPFNPQTLCTLTGAWQPQLVTQTMISWSATMGTSGTAGASVIATLNLFSGTSTVRAQWTGGGLMDGLHAWNADESALAYLTSDSNAVKLHLLQGGADRVVASLGPVPPGRPQNPNEDSAYLAFSTDGKYFALVQTYTASGDQLQVRNAADGSLVYSQAEGTMATWESVGSRLWFRRPQKSEMDSWDPSFGVTTQATNVALHWIAPRADAGANYIAFWFRDLTSGDSAPPIGTPHTYLWAPPSPGGPFTEPHSLRSSPIFLNSSTLFYFEEASCAPDCGSGPPTRPDGRTFIYVIGGGETDHDCRPRQLAADGSDLSGQ